MPRFVGMRFRLFDQLTCAIDLAQLPTDQRESNRSEGPPSNAEARLDLHIKSMIIIPEPVLQMGAGVRKGALSHTYLTQHHFGFRNVQRSASVS